MKLAKNMKPYLKEFKGPSRAMEIGVFEGECSRWIIDNILTHKDSWLVGIDPYVDINIKKMTFMKRYSQDVMLGNEFRKESFDFIYIDGHHTVISVMRDFVFTWPLLKVGGIMVFDDYGMLFRDGVKVAVDAILHGLGEQKWRKSKYKRLFGGYQVGIRKITDSFLTHKEHLKKLSLLRTHE